MSNIFSFCLIFLTVFLTHVFIISYEFNKDTKVKIKNLSKDVTNIDFVKLEKKQEFVSNKIKPIKEEKTQNRVLKKTVIPKKNLVKKEDIKKELKKEEVVKNSKKYIKKQEVNRSKDKLQQKSLVKKQKENSLEKKHIKLYISYVRSVVEKNKFYPRIAKAMKLEGNCLIKLKVLNSGKIETVEFEKPTHYKVLNKSTLKIFKSIENFKAFPKEISKKYLTLRVPISYKIKG